MVFWQRTDEVLCTKRVKIFWRNKQKKRKEIVRMQLTHGIKCARAACIKGRQPEIVEARKLIDPKESEPEKALKTRRQKAAAEKQKYYTLCVLNASSLSVLDTTGCLFCLDIYGLIRILRSH